MAVDHPGARRRLSGLTPGRAAAVVVALVPATYLVATAVGGNGVPARQVTYGVTAVAAVVAVWWCWTRAPASSHDKLAAHPTGRRPGRRWARFVGLALVVLLVEAAVGGCVAGFAPPQVVDDPGGVAADALDRRNHLVGIPLVLAVLFVAGRGTAGWLGSTRILRRLAWTVAATRVVRLLLIPALPALSAALDRRAPDEASLAFAQLPAGVFMFGVLALGHLAATRPAAEGVTGGGG